MHDNTHTLTLSLSRTHAHTHAHTLSRTRSFESKLTLTAVASKSHQVRGKKGRLLTCTLLTFHSKIGACDATHTNTSLSLSLFHTLTHTHAHIHTNTHSFDKKRQAVRFEHDIFSQQFLLAPFFSCYCLSPTVCLSNVWDWLGLAFT